MSLDEQIRESMKNIVIPEPVFDYYLFGASLFVWKKPELYLEAVETYPYEMDGQTPLLMLKIAWFEIMFESKLVYKVVYKLKHGFAPRGLE